MNLSPPIPGRRMWRLVMRNYLVWKKLLASSVAVHLADPVIFMLGFGFGLGALIGDVEGLSYLQFVAAGMVAYGTMNSASFEALYSAFTRMHVQRTWESILNAPMNLDDILLGEWLWAAIKGLMAGVAMLVVLTVLGLASWPLSFLAIPCIFVAALAFSGIALAVNAAARGYDFFSYYFSLFITPMMMLSGAFFSRLCFARTLACRFKFLAPFSCGLSVAPAFNRSCAAVINIALGGFIRLCNHRGLYLRFNYPSPIA